MKQILILLLIALTFSTAILSQAYEGSIEYDKKKQAAIIIEYAYSPDATENAIVQKMEKLGYHAKEARGIFTSDKGFRNYKGAIINDISSSSMDYVVKVEKRSRKDKDASVLYLILLKEGNNALSSGDDDLKSKTKSFLNALQPDVEASNLELQINAQQETINKAQKKLKSLKDDQASMEKKIKNLQDDIVRNIKEQENTQKNIEDQSKALESLKANRKSN